MQVASCQNVTLSDMNDVVSAVILKSTFYIRSRNLR